MTTIVMLAFGTRGDVGPVAGLGVRLAQNGFRVAVAAQEPYRDLVIDAGLEYRWLPKDTEAATRESAASQAMVDGGRMKPSRAALREMSEAMQGVGPAMAKASADADLLLAASPASTLFGYHIAEGLGIPSAALLLQPLAPTGDFPPPPLGTRSLGRVGNKMLWKLGAKGDKVYLPLVNEVRESLGLPATTVGHYQRERDATWPMLHGFSETVVPRPSDWRPGIEITGYWWPPVPTGWQPPQRLVDFLAAGPPPVYVGLGSTATAQGERLSAVVTEALRAAGARGIVQSGWAKLRADGDDVLTVDDLPHDWLFPRCAAVVHHCGAGTTAGGLRAGVPTVAVPGIMDQPFWAKRLESLGVAPPAIPRKDLTSDRLAAAIHAVVERPEHRAAAQAVSAKLAAEDGAGRATEFVERLLSA